MPIKYDKLFLLLKEQGKTMYNLRRDKVIGTATLEKMRKGEGHIDTRSIERLCEYLKCQPGDIMGYTPAPALTDDAGLSIECPLCKQSTYVSVTNLAYRPTCLHCKKVFDLTNEQRESLKIVERLAKATNFI